jgi:hypothetical protein
MMSDLDDISCQLLRNRFVHLSCTVRATMTLWLRLKNDSISCNASDEYPERFAQEALGHNSKAVHHACSKHAEVNVPSLDDWENEWNSKTTDQRPLTTVPKLVPVDFWAQPDNAGAVEGEMPVRGWLR